jgi:phosphatidylserine decarboxylase
MNEPTTKASADPTRLSDWLKVLPLYPLPHHAISRLTHAATRWRAPWWKDAVITWFVRRYGVDMNEAANPDPGSYQHFNDFFTRSLRPDARPLPDDPYAVVSPADGTISAIGRIEERTILQAKGNGFTVSELLGGDAELARQFDGGHFVTVYLSPRDYHRVHMPLGGLLRQMIHIPGRLFSVAPFTVRTVRKLFARNERVAALFETPRGPMAMVLVGAINVASIETVWSGVVTPPMGKRVRRWNYENEKPRRLSRGQEMGRFNTGSTVVLLFGPGHIEWLNEIGPDQKVRMGQALGRESGVEQYGNVVRLDNYKGRPH